MVRMKYAHVIPYDVHIVVIEYFIRKEQKEVGSYTLPYIVIYLFLVIIVVVFDAR